MMKWTDLIIPAAVVGVIAYAVSKFKNPFGDWGSWKSPFNLGGSTSVIDQLTPDELAAVEDSGGTVTDTPSMPFYMNFIPFGNIWDYWNRSQEETVYKGESPPLMDMSKGVAGRIMSFTPSRTYIRTDVKFVPKKRSDLRVALDAWATVNPVMYPGYKVGTTILDKVTGADQKVKVVTERQYTRGAGTKGQQKMLSMMQQDLRRARDIFKARGLVK